MQGTQITLANGDIATYHARGAFAVIFKNAAADRAYKVFRSEKVDLSFPNRQRQAIYNAEVRAYEIATRDALVQRYVPAFYGSQSVQSVSGPDGSNQSHMFLLDCCYEMEFLAADCESKLGALSDNKRVIAAKERLRSLGIRYTLDSTVMFTGTDFKFVDFGVCDPHGDASCWASDLDHAPEIN